MPPQSSPGSAGQRAGAERHGRGQRGRRPGTQHGARGAAPWHETIGKTSDFDWEKMGIWTGKTEDFEDFWEKIGLLLGKFQGISIGKMEISGNVYWENGG